MQEYQKDDERMFFQWLSSTVSPAEVDEIKKAYLSINTMLTKRKILPDKLANIKQIEQIQAAQQMINSTFANKKQRIAADKMVSLYLTYVGEHKPLSDLKQSAAYSSELLEQAKAIISNNFANGMRKNSMIAKKKFKAAYLEQIGIELSETIDIDDLAASVGYEYADKIYVLSECNKTEIKALVNKAFASGCRVIFYEELYRQHMDFMTQAGVFTAELLKNTLKKISPELVYRRSFFAVTLNDTLENAIAACFEGKIVKTYNEIKAELPYADMSSIRFACSQDSRFVWVREGTYAFVQSLSLAENDVITTEKVIEQDIEIRGFSVIYRVCVDESKNLNPDISETALRDAVFLRYLSQKYERKRSVIMKPGASFHAPDIMNIYCQGLRKATLGELLEYEKDITEKTTYSLTAAYENMLRIDRELFVALDEVQFDVQTIDNAIALYVNDSIIPLKSVKSFLAFPDIPGVPWNHFLLDSYCKHKSIRFRSMGGPAKGKLVGAIFPSTMKFDSYDELLATVIAKSNLELREDDVCTFLSEHAYTLRRINPGRIIIKAQEIRNQEE